MRPRFYDCLDTKEKIGLVVIVLLVLSALGFLVFAVRVKAEFLQRCSANGGQVVEIHRSEGLCISQDGRIIPIAKE